MAASNFPQPVLAGKSAEYSEVVNDLQKSYGFDFVAIGLTSFVGAPLRWVYSAGATGERYKRIVLAPGHGIGGIVIKAGKPMIFTDIDKEIDPREYSSYPIVFAEDLRSFSAFPLVQKGKVVGTLLCAFRTVSSDHAQVYKDLIRDMHGKVQGLDVITEGFLDMGTMITAEAREASADQLKVHSDLSRVISAQENERKRISRELHDGIIQELLSVSFTVRELETYLEGERARELCEIAGNNINRILDELHNISVELRPSALDHFGLLSALRSQAEVLERAYGAEIIVVGNMREKRFSAVLETQIFRICQEAILNACKYSGTDQIVVELEESNEWIHTRVSDQGEGFDADNPPIKGSGCGLSGMRERASLIGATLDVESSAAGTTITLVAPLGLSEERKQ
ncbi:MAG: GAF domain-containing sensor histidine kinase [Raoultibacter sp.]|jgi:two-component system sensor histidine kinase NreB